MRELSVAALARHTASPSLEALGFAGLADVCRAASAAHAPLPDVAVDPRSGLSIVSSPSRAGRLGLPDDACAVCDEHTCAAVDVVDLPAGDQAWLTPNLYPIVHPFEAPAASAGLHLVHWSSRRHAGGWPGADPATAAALLAQLARAEGFLLHAAPQEFASTGGDGHRGHVGVIKNRGRRVGGSVEHDHQQILLTSRPFLEPPRTRGLADVLRAEATPARLVDDVDGLALTLVPSFMARPLQAFVVPRGPDVGWLHHLDDAVRDAVALAVARLGAAVSACMRARHGEPAWNLIVHTGEGCAPLLELRPFTQPLGGYEQLGLYLTEERPEDSAAALRAALPR